MYLPTPRDQSLSGISRFIARAERGCPIVHLTKLTVGAERGNDRNLTLHKYQDLMDTHIVSFQVGVVVLDAVI